MLNKASRPFFNNAVPLDMMSLTYLIEWKNIVSGLVLPLLPGQQQYVDVEDGCRVSSHSALNMIYPLPGSS